jgi:hypothetical protein
VSRHASEFTLAEFYNITNKLVPLFFTDSLLQQYVDVNNENKYDSAIQIMFYQKQVKTQQEIDAAMHFIPFVDTTNMIPVSNEFDPLTKVEVSIDGKKFTDLIQYIYYKLYQHYGGISFEESYNHLLQNGHLLNGNSDLLQRRLEEIVASRRQQMIIKALTVKFYEKPIKEIIYYLKSINLNFTIDDNTHNIWKTEIMPLTKPLENTLMDWVVSIVPQSLSNHFEKSKILFDLMKDLFKSLKIFKSIVKRSILTENDFIKFFTCFCHNFLIGNIDPNQHVPDDFLSLASSYKITSKNNIRYFLHYILSVKYYISSFIIIYFLIISFELISNKFMLVVH